MSDLQTFLSSVTVEDLERDPYPIYQRLRESQEIGYLPCVDLWFATSWADVANVGTENSIFSAELGGNSPLDIAFDGPSILTMEGPHHLALRQSMDEKYRPKNVSNWIEDVVRPIARTQVAKLSPGKVDLLSEYFEPISVLSLGAVLGVGHLDDSTLRRWFYGLREGAINYESSQDRFAETAIIAREIDETMAEVFDRIEGKPDDSTISHMLFTGMPEGQMRSRAALMPTIKVMLLGGAQEPGHGAATTMYGLLSHPDQLAAVLGDASLIPVAVDEGIRWVSPIGTQVRETQSDVILGATTIAKGARVAAVLSSANRDAAIFGRSADEFDINREKRAHAGFGFGRHFCTGHAFSKQQIAIALEELLAKFPEMSLNPEHEVRFEGWEFRAPTALHVILK
jgi:cytochrome P450